jgi:phosphate transport system substrate-binding protein
MTRNNIYTIAIFVLVLLMGCSDQSDKIQTVDTPTKGTIRISVDESFKPVIEEQLRNRDHCFL